MIREYIANNKESPQPIHRENRGCDILGYIHIEAGASITENSKLRIEHGLFPRVPYEATAEQCKKDATLLRTTPDEVFVTLLDNPLIKECFGGTAQDFLDFIKEWSEFLENCEGYKVPR